MYNVLHTFSSGMYLGLWEGLNVGVSVEGFDGTIGLSSICSKAYKDRLKKPASKFDSVYFGWVELIYLVWFVLSIVSLDTISTILSHKAGVILLFLATSPEQRWLLLTSSKN